MKKILFSTLALVVLLMVSCKPDPIIDEDKTGNIEINFVAEYQGSPLVIFGENYSYPDLGNTFNVKNFQFLISDLILIKEGTGDGTELAEIDLIDFMDKDTEELAIKGTARSYESIPVGEYSGIRFGFGVNNELNRAESQEDYTLDEPLGTGFWNGWSSYVFSRLEGDFDMDGNDMYGDSTDFSYSLHTGTNEGYNVITLVSPISIVADDSNVIKVVVDIEKMLKNTFSGEVYDIVNEENQTTHSLSNAEEVLQLLNNTKGAFSIR